MENSNETYLTVRGYLLEDPLFGVTKTGRPWVNMMLGSTPRTKRADGTWQDNETLKKRLIAWDRVAQNIEDSSLKSGQAVICYGTLRARKYERRNGTTETIEELHLIGFGPDLSLSVATAIKPVDRRAAVLGTADATPPRDETTGQTNSDEQATSAADDDDDLPPGIQ